MSLKNVTVTLDDQVARWARVKAAEADMSLSRWLGQLLERNMADHERYEAGRLAFAKLAPMPIRQPGTSLPTREEAHDRPGLR